MLWRTLGRIGGRGGLLLGFGRLVLKLLPRNDRSIGIYSYRINTEEVRQSYMNESI